MDTEKLIKLDADVSIAIDSRWKEWYSSRSIEDMNQSEKVIVSNDKLIDSSINVTIKNANAEFIGLIILKPKVMKFLKNMMFKLIIFLVLYLPSIEEIFNS